MGAFPCAAAVLLLPVFAMHAADGPGSGMNRFATELYQQFARGSGNLVLSPLSNHSALSMLADGARGETAGQLSRALHLTGSGADRTAAVTSLVDQLRAHGNTEGSELLTAQGLWIQQGFPVRSDYERVLVQSYRASVTQFDFARNPEQARVNINFWTASQTKGKIQELFAPGSLGNNTRMVVTNAIYFHGLWQSPFPVDGTRPESFRIGARETVKVDTMNQTGTFAFAELPGVQVLEMKYGRGPVVCDILLPKTADGLGALEASLTPEKLLGFWANLGSREAAVSLPRFRVETNVSLRNALGSLGVSDAFGDAADFSGVDDRRDLALSDLRHKAFLEVAEQGTIAAAVSGGAVRLIASAPPPLVFRVDHPFLFLIRDTRSGVILFMGRVIRP